MYYKAISLYIIKNTKYPIFFKIFFHIFHFIYLYFFYFPF